MKKTSIGDSNYSISLMKRMLGQLGYFIDVSPEFDAPTCDMVIQFQKDFNLVPDGIVGKNTWQKLLEKGYRFNLGATNYILEPDEWIEEYVEKDTLYLHHTAGAHRPDYTIGWWEKDSKPGELRRIATSFVIGRKSVAGDETFDGATFRAFNEMYWAYHLGIKASNNTLLNQKSIGIEICSLGPLQKAADSTFYFQSGDTKINVPKSEVCELNKAWRGHTYFQRYTDKQIKECERLILTLAKIFGIPLRDMLYDSTWFNINTEAEKGGPGLWTHCNVRKDKTDCFPQPEFIEMLNGLYAKYPDFEPDLQWDDSSLESMPIGSPKDLDAEILQEYAMDLD
ncbi:hypothetical protein LCGC14_1381800 [marine sediment metagenome]|uniref:Peptidoglycan binding domain-containing protein n=2 Tax=root TaxID=1 RepID=A0A831QS32_9FLAO|nr:hypothetical protein [Pricia antarctica]